MSETGGRVVNQEAGPSSGVVAGSVRSWGLSGRWVERLSRGAVKVSDLKENVVNWRWAGSPHASHWAGSSAWETGRIRSNSVSHSAQ